MSAVHPCGSCTSMLLQVHRSNRRSVWVQGASPWQLLEPIPMIQAGIQTVRASSKGWHLRTMLVPTVTWFQAKP